MMLIGSKPFRQGDFVAVDGEEATVDDIGVVYTRMHTVDNRRVLIPNSKLMDATLENYTALGKRRVETEVSASYDCDPQDVFAALQKAIARCEPLEGEERLTEIQSFGDSAITYAVWFWIPAERIIQARFDIRRYIWEEFKAAGIVMTYPHLNVHLDREEA
jgi:small conductance mechanosensitive channel